MPETRQVLRSKLTLARQELVQAQVRVSALETLLNDNAEPLRASQEPTGDKNAPFNQAIFPRENPNPLLAVARDSTLVYANPASRYLQARLDCQIGSRLPKALQSVVTQAFTTKTPKAFEANYDDIHFALTFVPYLDSDYVYIYGLDITERKRSELALKRYAQRLEILHQIDLALIRGGAIPTLVEVVLNHIRQLIPCLRASVSLFDEPTNEMLVYAVDHSRASDVDKGVRVTLPSNWLDGFDADNARTIDDLRLVDDLIPAQRQLLKEGLVAFLHVVLRVQGRSIGLLALSSDNPGFFTIEYRDIAIEIANQLALAIHQMHLSETLERHTAELEQRVQDRTADLNSAKQRVEAILNNSPDGILLLSPDHIIQQTNPSFNTLFACETDNYWGKALVTLIHGDDVARVTKLIEAVVTQQRGQSVEFNAFRTDSTVFDAELSIGPIKDKGFLFNGSEIELTQVIGFFDFALFSIVLL